VVLLGEWLVSSIRFLLSTEQVVIGRWGMSASSCRVVRAVVVFTRLADLTFSCKSVWSASPAARCGNSVLNAPLCPYSSTPGSTTCPASQGWPVAPPLLSAFVAEMFSLPRGCARLFSLGMGREVVYGAWCSSINSADSGKQLWNWHGLKWCCFSQCSVV
jgi:hypothetical protein